MTVDRPASEGRAPGPEPRGGLLAAWVQVTGDARGYSPEYVSRLFERGGTPALFDEVAGLAAHAVAVGAYLDARAIEQERLLRRWSRVAPTDTKVVGGLLLMSAVNASRWSVARWPVVAGWLRVLAGDCDLDRAANLATGLNDWSAPVDAFPIGRLGGLGALAYTAGLSGEEAVAAYRAGTLTAGDLEALAVLRGYRLPLVLP